MVTFFTTFDAVAFFVAATFFTVGFFAVVAAFFTAYDGLILKFRGGGNAGKLGGVAGDLYMTLQVEAFKKFRRERELLYGDLEISPALAVLGGTREIETPTGVTKLTIPAGTQPGDILTVKGGGAYKLSTNQKGDMKLTIKIVIPKKLSRTEKELWEKLA